MSAASAAPHSCQHGFMDCFSISQCQHNVVNTVNVDQQEDIYLCSALVLVAPQEKKTCIILIKLLVQSLTDD